MILEQKALDDYLKQYVEILKNIFHDKLLKVVLFGSYARGEANDDSDIDVFIVIDMNEDTLYDYRDKLLKDTVDFNMDNDIDIQIITMEAPRYNRYKYAEMLLLNIRDEGITYYENMKENEKDIDVVFDITKIKTAEAVEGLEDAKLLFDNQEFLGTTNRLYYSIFKAISAVHNLDGNKFKNQKDALAQFNKLYIHTDIFPREFADKMFEIQEIKQKEDYGAILKLKKEMIEEYLIFTKKFINALKEYIQNKI